MNSFPGRGGSCDDRAVVIRPRLLVHDEGAVVAAAGSHRVGLVVRLVLPEVSLPDLRAQLYVIRRKWKFLHCRSPQLRLCQHVNQLKHYRNV